MVTITARVPTGRSVAFPATNTAQPLSARRGETAPGSANNEPILLDFATSRVALGKVRVAHNAGKPMLDGALLDHTGKPTTDPSVSLGVVEKCPLTIANHHDK